MSNPNPHTEARDNAQRCTKLRQKDRQPCRGFAVRGTDPPACRKHLGTPRSIARSKEAIRTAVTRWGLNDTSIDPGLVMVRLVSQSAERVGLYADLLGQAY